YRNVLYLVHSRTGDVIGRARLLGALDNYFASPVVADGKLCLVKSERQGRAHRFGSLPRAGPAGSHSTRISASAAATAPRVKLARKPNHSVRAPCSKGPKLDAGVTRWSSE